MQRILIIISKVSILVETDWQDILEILKKDFWSFLSQGSTSPFGERPQIHLKIFKTRERPWMPEVVSSMQTQNAITYDLGTTRYCDYYGQAYSKVDFSSEQVSLYGDDFELVHELSYLILLSRVGKKLDLIGVHKLHSFAISFKELAFVCMMPSKGGKSTLLAELLLDERVKMISDDIPLVDSFGNIHSFPLKIGLDVIPEKLSIQDKDNNVYTMKRKIFGDKTLICTKGLTDRIEHKDKVFKKIILAEAFRYNSKDSSICRTSWIKTFKGLFKHGVIGVGSPIIIEYFWERGWKDFCVKSKIFLLRCVAFSSLCFKAERIEIRSGMNPELTAKKILNFLENKSR